MEITLRKKLTNNGVIDMERTFISFRSKHQLPLIMIIREYWWGEKVIWAKVLFSTR